MALFQFRQFVGLGFFGEVEGRLEFRGESLSEAVAEFNRYNRRQIRLDGTSLNTLRVGGSFASTDPDSFVDALASAFNLRVDNQDAGTILLRPP